MGTGPTFLYMVKEGQALKTLGIVLVKVKKCGRASVFQGWLAVWSDLNTGSCGEGRSDRR